MDADKLIYDMFLENTGKALCDSGDYYGRNWERNLKNHPANLPAIEWEIWNGTIQYTINTYHALINNHLECDDICDTFNELNIGCDNWGSDTYYGVCSQADDYLNEIGARLIGDTWNTYNGDSALSQVLQGAYIDIDGYTYVLIQLHQGCDVRGGYTDARLFKLNSWRDYLDTSDVDGICTRDGVKYNISNRDDGYNIKFDDIADIFDDIVDSEFNESDIIELWLIDY